MKKIIMFLLIITAFYGFCSAAKYDPMAENQYMEQANNIFSMGKYKQALKLYETAFKINADNIQAVIGQGNCHEMMGEPKASKVDYDLAKSMDPSFVKPDLSRYKAMDKERAKGKSADDIRAKYYDLFPGMKKGVTTTPATGDRNMVNAMAGGPPAGQAEASGSTKTSVSMEATGAATVLTENDVKKMTVTEKAKPDMDKLTNEEAQQFMDDRLYDFRGGHGKMEALGGMRHIIPDMTTSMDGGSFGLDTALLFRKKTHVFNLEPFYGLYTKNTTYNTPDPKITNNYRTQLISLEDSVGELNFPSQYFFNRVKPFLSNSFMEGRLDNMPVPPASIRMANTGSFFGGEYTLGFKPISLMGFTIASGYEYSPYYQDISVGVTHTTTTITNMQFYWRAGVGVYLPYLFTKNDQLEAHINYGAYRPEALVADLRNNKLFGMPYSLINDYSKKITEHGATPYDFSMRYEDSNNMEATGNNIKASVHYMYGNNLQEVFFFYEMPHNIKYKVSKTSDLFVEGSAVPISSTVVVQEDAGTEKRWNGKTGFRSNFRYLTIGLRYEYDSRETYISSTYTVDYQAPAIFDQLVPQGALLKGREYEKNTRLTLGVNLTPVDLINLPFEYETNQYYINMGGSIMTSDSYVFRGGLQLKPTPFFAIRGGISYEVFRYGGTGFGDPGTDSNPTRNILGYHFGAGIDMPLFEFNAGGAIKTLTRSPLPAALSSETNTYMYGYVDFNIYI